MSGVLFWAVIFPISYVVPGIGTSRVVYARQYKRYYPGKLEQTKNRYSIYENEDPHKLTSNDDKVFGPALFAFWFWPGFAVWLLLIKPIGTIVWPVLVKWYTAPARRAVES